MKKVFLLLSCLFSSTYLLQAEEILTFAPRVEFTKVTSKCKESVTITVDFSIYEAKLKKCELVLSFYDNLKKRLVSSHSAFHKYNRSVAASIPFTVNSNTLHHYGKIFTIPFNQFNLKGFHNLKYKLMVVSDGQILGESNFYDLKCTFPPPINGSGGSSTDGTTPVTTHTRSDNLCSVDITLDKCTDYQSYSVLIKQLGGTYSKSKRLESKNVQFQVPKGEYEISVFIEGKVDGTPPYNNAKIKVDQPNVKLTLPRIR